MTRITPRTCLWPLAGSLSLTFALSFGLTFRSNHHCYAGTCGEWLFPLQARLHVVVWYCWLSISVTFLALRTFNPRLRRILRTPLFERKLPILGKQLAFSGVLIFVWIIALYGIVIGVWWIRLRGYFRNRGIDGGVLSGNGRLAAIALTGHMCDITMGMVLIPISRHSALASFFKISVATTLAFHMLLAYTLFTLVLTHGVLYISWVPVFENLSQDLRMVYPVLNPTYLYQETWPGKTSSLGVWRASLIFTGSLTTFIMLLLFITTFPAIRSRHFNVFYFTHLLSIAAVVVICLHASTMFYCTAPGLMMWILDWGMRLYELKVPLNGNIIALGKGWYCLSVPLPRRRLDGCACSSPLAHFYIYHSESSIRELHPFTTTTHLASQNTITHYTHDDIDIQFLFRKSKASPVYMPPSETALGFAPSLFSIFRKLKHRKPASQWTNKLAGLADGENHPGFEGEDLTRTAKLKSPASKPELLITKPPIISRSVPVSLHLEGPYFTPADPARYANVVCIVAGTGVSGALAIAGAFQELERKNGVLTDTNPQDSRTNSIITIPRERVWKRCVVIWSVREADFIDLPGLKVKPSSSLDVRIHLTGVGHKRLSVGDALDDIMKRDGTASPPSTPIWVYVSGPNAFIAAGEAACKERQKQGVEWYGARWDI